MLSQPIFLPSNLYGGAAWLDATRQALGAISTWSDQFGNGNNAVQASGAAQPINTANKINGNPALVFDGTNSFMTINALASLMSGTNKSVTVFTVTTTTTISSDGYHFLWGNTTGTNPLFGFRYHATSTFQALKRDDSSALKQPSGGTALINIPYVSAIVNFGSTIDAYINNTKVIAAGDISLGATTVDDFAIGASNRNGTVSLFLSGLMGEFIVFNRALSAVEVAAINNYLILKWGTASS